MNTVALPQLPSFQSHKVVSAMKIADIRHISAIGHDSFCLVNADQDAAVPEVYVSPEFVAKHSPAVGGYYVRYQDGYESWSPADAFETGYSPVGDAEQLPSAHQLGDVVTLRGKVVAVTFRAGKVSYSLGLQSDITVYVDSIDIEPKEA